MKKPNLTKMTKTVSVALKKHSPEILTGLGIAGMISTTVMAVRATPKAILILNEEECRRSKLEGPQDSHIRFRDKVQLTWRCYVPATITGTASIACLVFANSVNARRNAALATAYSISESVLREYQEKVIETIGEKKEQGVRDAIAKDHIDRNPVVSNEVIITNKGETLCYDMLSGRYFKTDIDKLRRVENDLYRKMLDEQYVSLNDFYYEIGMDVLHPMGDDLGWNLDEGRMDLYFTSQLTTEGTPCLVVNYRVAPKYDYYKHG